MVVLVSVLVPLSVACGESATNTTSGTDRSTVSSTLGGEVLVSAAASLRDAFGEIGAAFEEANTGVEVVLNLAGSSSLREQILQGAPADVFASANTSNMEQVVEAGEVSGPSRVLASNMLQIAVPSGNPGGVTGLGDFARSDLLIGLCAEGVPCGVFAREALAKAGVTPAIDTSEPDVRALLTKIELGELDAGITYVTDVISTGGSVDGIEIAESQNVTAVYPIAVLAGAANPNAAQAFVTFVLSDEGQTILGDYGFDSP